MIGFTFRGKHSRRDMDIVFRTRARPIVPHVRIIEDEIPYEDGSLDFSEQNGRLYYDDKIIELEITIIRNGLPALHKKISKVVSWLSGGYGDLIFDDMPYVIWTAKPVNIGSIAPELMRVGKTVIQFRCRPFNRLIFSSYGIPLDSAIQLDSGIRIGYGSENYYDLIAGENEIEMEYIGDAPVRPTICFTGEIKNLTIICGEFELSFAGAADGLQLDCKNRIATIGEQDVTEQTMGEFLELKPGNNRMVISCGSGSGSVFFDYYPQFLYGDVNFSD